MANDIPADVQQFLGQHVESLAQLEVLIYLRQHADRKIHPGEVANRLAITAEMSAAILADLARREIAVKEDACFRYQVASGEIDRVIQVLAETYRDRRLAVTNEIYSKSMEKVKTFAEAFRIRKET